MKWNFNDYFALVVTALMAAMWVANKWVDLPDIVLGGTVPMFTLIIQYYFRRAPSNGT